MTRRLISAHVCTHACTHARKHTRTRTCACLSARLPACTDARTHARTYVHVHTHAHTCPPHTPAHARTFACPHALMQVYIHGAARMLYACNVHATHMQTDRALRSQTRSKLTNSSTRRPAWPVYIPLRKRVAGFLFLTAWPTRSNETMGRCGAGIARLDGTLAGIMKGVQV